MEQSKHKHDNCSRCPQQVGGRGEHTQQSEQTSSVARLRRWVQLSSSERQRQELGFDSGASGLQSLCFGHGCLDLTSAYVRAKQQQKRRAVFPRAALRRSGNAQGVLRRRALAGSG